MMTFGLWNLTAARTSSSFVTSSVFRSVFTPKSIYDPTIPLAPVIKVLGRLFMIFRSLGHYYTCFEQRIKHSDVQPKTRDEREVEVASFKVHVVGVGYFELTAGGRF